MKQLNQINRLTGMLLMLAVMFFAIAPSGEVAAQGDGRQVEASVLPSSLFMREGPGVNFTAVVEMSFGTRITVIGYENQVGNGGVWVYGSTTSGATGWTLSTFLRFPEGFVFNTDLPVLAVDSAVVVSAPVTEATETVTTTDTVGSPGVAGYQTNTYVNFRTAPTLSANIILVTDPATGFTLRGRNAAADWVFVDIGGQAGWLYRPLTTVNADVAAGLPLADVETGTVEEVTPGTGNVVVGGVNYYSINLFSEIAVSGSNDFDGRINPYTYLTTGVIYCFDSEFYTDRRSYAGGGIAVYLLYGNPQGFVFVASEAEINAIGIPTTESTLIRAESGFALYRETDSAFRMVMPNRDGTIYQHVWYACSPNPTAR